MSFVDPLRTLRLIGLLPTIDKELVVPKFMGPIQSHCSRKRHGGVVAFAFELVPSHDYVGMGAEKVEVIDLHGRAKPSRTN
jgi:hypothetical protein